LPLDLERLGKQALLLEYGRHLRSIRVLQRHIKRRFIQAVRAITARCAIHSCIWHNQLGIGTLNTFTRRFVRQASCVASECLQLLLFPLQNNFFAALLSLEKLDLIVLLQVVPLQSSNLAHPVLFLLFEAERLVLELIHQLDLQALHLEHFAIQLRQLLLVIQRRLHHLTVFGLDPLVLDNLGLQALQLDLVFGANFAHLVFVLATVVALHHGRDQLFSLIFYLTNTTF